MKLTNDCHLTYCTNVHPAETWEEIFNNLKSYVLPLKQRISPELAFGIGLWLSDQAAKELKKENQLLSFKTWLQEHQLYVFTMNGFPFGKFHNSEVKDKVHQPDWTTRERLCYTLNLIEILAELLPEDVESGSISTSPVSYRLWEKNLKDPEKSLRLASHNFGIVVEHLYRLEKDRKIRIHLDIEPEPDGLIESCTEATQFFRTMLYPEVGAYLQEKLGISFDRAKKLVQEHLGICYDICHSALLYEEPVKAIGELQAEGIKIGKMQISSAIRIAIPESSTERQSLHDQLSPYADTVYLHQVIEGKGNGVLEHYPDLSAALDNIYTTVAEEWRIHFHIPIFVENYGRISSTRSNIERVLEYLEENRFTRHLEIETYTWEVLPQEKHESLVDSLEREYQWVLQKITKK